METLRIVCIVLGLVGAVEFVGLVVILILMASEPRIRDRRKRRSDG